MTLPCGCEGPKHVLGVCGAHAPASRSPYRDDGPTLFCTRCQCSIVKGTEWQHERQNAARHGCPRHFYWEPDCARCRREREVRG